MRNKPQNWMQWWENFFNSHLQIIKRFVQIKLNWPVFPKTQNLVDDPEVERTIFSDQRSNCWTSNPEGQTITVSSMSPKRKMVEIRERSSPIRLTAVHYPHTVLISHLRAVKHTIQTPILWIKENLPKLWLTSIWKIVQIYWLIFKPNSR